MYAIFESGGKQHRVVEGETLRLEKLEAAAGDTINFDRVLLVNDGGNLHIGVPYVAGSTVTAEVVGQGRAEKVKIIKFRRRKHHDKRMGHRQSYTDVKITGISPAMSTTGSGKTKDQADAQAEAASVEAASNE